jgi:hypothetical protein
LCITANSGGQCPLWVKSRHRSGFERCLLYPRKRTSNERSAKSALCQKQTSGPNTIRSPRWRSEAAVACARKPKLFGAYIRNDMCQRLSAVRHK